MILEPERIPEAAAIVSSSADFYSAKNGAMFAVLLSAYETHGTTFDLIAVAQAFRDAGTLEEIGGPEYLIRLAEGVPSAVNCSHYASIVAHKSKLRQVIEAAGEALYRCYNGGEADFQSIIEQSAHEMASACYLNGLAEKSGVRAVCSADIVAEEVRWLWPGRIPLGKLTLIAGDPGLGKSFCTIDLAARVSSGAGWPDNPDARQQPGGCILFSAEDDPADTIIPRLIAAGADRSRVFVAQSVIEKNGERSVNLERDMNTIRKAIGQVPDCRMVVIDPISAYTGKADTHNNAETRGLLAPLAKLAADLGVAVVLVTHLNKSGGGKALYRAIGSIAFAAAARCAYAVCKDSENPARRLFLPTKNNLGPDHSGLAYTLGMGPDSTTIPVVLWEREAVTDSADEAMGGAEKPQDAETKVERSEAEEWLSSLLAAGPVPSNTVKRRAAADGLSWRAVQRAKEAIGVRPSKAGFAKDGEWSWSLAAKQPGEGEPYLGDQDFVPEDG